jgi:p-hydroxybenzoate 3-monooxygenase
VPNGTDAADWSDDRIWDGLATRLGHGQDGWELATGPITEKSVLPMRSFVQQPMRHGRLFLAGDAAHIVPPTGAKGLNLAVADVALLAPALVAMLAGDHGLADAYSDTALRRVWRCTHFSWWMTTMLHAADDPFDRELQLSQLRWVASSEAGAAGLAENYAGLPIGF